MAFLPFTSEPFPTTSTTTSTRTNSSANSDVFYIKCSLTLAGLNKLETQSMNSDIEELANVFLTLWGVAGLNSISPNTQCEDLQCVYFKIYVFCLEFPFSDVKRN